MRKRLIAGILAAIALVFVMANPASARVANVDNCTPTTSLCDLLLVAQTGQNPPQNIWIYGDTHTVEMQARTDAATQSQWFPVSGEPGWYYVVTANGFYWTAANTEGNSLAGIFPEGFVNGDTHQWWHLEPSGTSHIIENYWGTTRYGVTCCEGGAGVPGDLEFTNGSGNYELWNFRM